MGEGDISKGRFLLSKCERDALWELMPVAEAMAIRGDKRASVALDWMRAALNGEETHLMHWEAIAAVEKEGGGMAYRLRCSYCGKDMATIDRPQPNLPFHKGAYIAPCMWPGAHSGDGSCETQKSRPE